MLGYLGSRRPTGAAGKRVDANPRVPLCSTLGYYRDLPNGRRKVSRGTELATKRLKRNQSHYTPNPQRPSRHDHQGSATLHETQQGTPTLVSLQVSSA